jgi:hypothetical protein
MLKASLLASLYPLLIAQSSSAKDLPDPKDWVTMGWVVAALFGIVGLANQGLELWRKLFPVEKPPASERFASKEELFNAMARIEADFETEIGRLEGDMDGDLTRIEARFEQWIKQFEGIVKDDQKVMQDWMRNVERALGHVETKIDAVKSRK